MKFRNEPIFYVKTCKFAHFYLRKVWIKQYINQNLHIFILILHKNEQKCEVSSRKFSISYLALNLPGMFWKMGKFENFITQVTKYGEKYRSFPFTLGISNWEITLSAQEREKVKNLLGSVISIESGIGK